jgi:hypothetical protein
VRYSANSRTGSEAKQEEWATSRKQGETLWGPETDHNAEGHQASSQVFRQGAVWQIFSKQELCSQKSLLLLGNGSTNNGCC